MRSQEEQAARAARAEARRGKMTGEVVPVGLPKPSPYAASSAEERIAAAVRLIGYHERLRGPRERMPRSQWPGEIVVIGADGG